MRPRLLALVLVVLVSPGCTGPSEPAPANLQVSVSTTGVDQDSSYAIRTDAGTPTPMRGALALTLAAGDHDVVLEDVAPNCSAEDPDSVRVTITPGQVAEVAFQVACRAVTGAIEVLVPTSGRDFDPDGYTVDLDDVARGRVYPGGSAVLEGVAAGDHVVRLGDLSVNCRLTDPASQTATVTTGGLTRDTVHLTFEGSCESITGDVQLVTTTGGVDLDPNGYTVTLDGELVIAPCGYWDYGCVPGAPLMLVPNGSNMLLAIASGTHEVRLGDIAPNCGAAGGDSRTVSVVTGEVTVVRFYLTCNQP